LYVDYSKEEATVDEHEVAIEAFNLRSRHQERNQTRAWRPAGGASLSVRCFDGELLVYNPLSGHTHYLDIVSGKALTLVASGVCETPAICSRIAVFLGVDADDQVAALVDQTLEKLEEVKLIERTAG
jgi:PqqD family protein of HPr-rel-A system